MEAPKSETEKKFLDPKQGSNHRCAATLDLVNLVISFYKETSEFYKHICLIATGYNLFTVTCGNYN